VIRKRTQLLLHNPARRARVLAVVLLASIAWGATAEFTHHHGAQSTVRFGALLSQAPASNGEQTATSRVGSGETEKSSSRSTNGADCLICQLHQNLSATLFNAPPRVVPVDIHVVSASATVIFPPSEVAANQHGRAPPSNL
jgi:methionine-rich copper-binding protein CopC